MWSICIRSHSMGNLWKLLYAVVDTQCWETYIIVTLRQWVNWNHIKPLLPEISLSRFADKFEESFQDEGQQLLFIIAKCCEKLAILSIERKSVAHTFSGFNVFFQWKWRKTPLVTAWPVTYLRRTNFFETIHVFADLPYLTKWIFFPTRKDAKWWSRGRIHWKYVSSFDCLNKSATFSIYHCFLQHKFDMPARLFNL